MYNLDRIIHKQKNIANDNKLFEEFYNKIGKNIDNVKYDYIADLDIYERTVLLSKLIARKNNDKIM